MDPRGLTESILRLCGLWLFWLGLEASFGHAAAFVHVLVPDAGAESMPLLMRVWLGSAFWPSSIPFLLQMVAAVGLFCPLALQRLWHKAMAQRPGR